MSKKNNSLVDWIDHRLPIFSFVNKHLKTYPTPRNLNYLWNFGSLAGIALMVMIITGLFLAMHYQPHPDEAFASVQRIMRDVNFGWLIRYLHINGASFFFIIVYIHMLRSLYYGSYKAPRELLWLFGVVILILMMMTAFLGYVLPWGQMSFWGATVITNLYSAIPFVGEAIVEWLWGGFSVGAPTLSRFYALHFLLPFIIVAVSGLHVIALHQVKSNNPLGVEVKTKKDTLPFHPYYTTKDNFGFALFFMLYLSIVFFSPEFFAERENAIKANDLVTPANIVPEWYFLPFYAILRAIPDKLGGVIVFALSVGVLALVPWLDRHPIKSGSFRPLYKPCFLLFLANLIILGWCGAHPPSGAYVIIARLATVYHFAFFLVIMPVLSYFEPVAKLPDSIDQARIKSKRKKGALS